MKPSIKEPEMPDEKPPWYMGAIDKYGFPTVFLVVFLYMIWSAGSWAGETVVVPLFQKQMQFIDKASEMTEEMNSTTKIINKTLEAHGQHAIESLKTCHDIRETGLETQTEVKEIRANHGQIVEVLQNIDENTKPLREGVHQ
jgi:hypothetical protein